MLWLWGAEKTRLRWAKARTLIPDADNAAVGNDFTLLQEDTTNGILLFFHTVEKGEAD